MAAITGEYILRGVKRRVTFPANDELFGDDGILEMMDGILRERLIPMMRSVHEEFFVINDTMAFTAGTSKYRIPYRAMARGLRELKIQDTGNTDNIWDLPMIELNDLQYYQQSNGYPRCFYFEGDYIVIVPPPLDTSYQLLRWYLLQPNQLVQTSDCAQVVSIASNVVNCTAVPSTITASTPIDFISGKQGNIIYSFDVTPTSVASPLITFASASAIPSELQAGDYIALAQETPLYPLPDETYPLAETLLGAKILDSIGDFEGSAKMLGESDRLQQDAMKLLEPRAIGAPQKIINRGGLLRGRGFNYWRSRGGLYW